MAANPEVNEINILAIKAHAEETRRQTKILDDIVKASNNTVATLQARIDGLENQVRTLQVKMFTGGATS